MTDTTSAAPPKTNPVKAKVGEVVMKGYLAAPPSAQNAMLNGFMKAQPVIAKVKPHRPKILAGLVGLFAVKKLRKRKA